MKEKTGPGAGVVAPTPGHSEGDSGHVATRMLVNILLQFHAEVHVFTRDTAVFEFEDERVQVHKISKPFAEFPWYLRLPGQFIYQVRYAYSILLQRQSLGIIIFGGGGFPIPGITARLSSMYLVYRIGGITYKEVPQNSYGDRIWRLFQKTFRKAQYAIANTIVILSPTLMEYADLGRFENKCQVWNHYYFDLDLFDRTNEYYRREAILGHIGVSQTKGTLKLIEAFEESDLADNYRLEILGDGPITEQAKSYAHENGLDVRFLGHIDRREIPVYYNRLRLFVNCSESEGVPKAMLEAMGCGTPVAATQVGGVPDYINHEETGYLLSDNNPATMATELEGILGSDTLESVSDQGRKFVVETFSYESTVQAYFELVSKTSACDLQPPDSNPEEPIPRHEY